MYVGRAVWVVMSEWLVGRVVTGRDWGEGGNSCGDWGACRTGVEAERTRASLLFGLNANLGMGEGVGGTVGFCGVFSLGD